MEMKLNDIDASGSNSYNIITREIRARQQNSFQHESNL